MAQRANIVLKLVDQLRKDANVPVNIPSFASSANNGAGNDSMTMDEDPTHKKKRSWDDDGNVGSEDIDVSC